MNKLKTLTINSDEIGERIDKFLSLKFPEYSRNYFVDLIKINKIKLNNKSIKPSYILKVGDRVKIEFLEISETAEARGEDIDLDIIYEDENVIVINKQPGLVVHPAAGHSSGTLVNAIINYFPAIKNAVYDKDNQVSKLRPGLVHRLDKDTSGVLIVAKNARSMHSLSRQIQNRTAKKIYFALCYGVPKITSGKLVNYLGRHPKNRKLIADIGTEKGKKAISNYKVITIYKFAAGTYSLVEFEIESGRTHQIRVQCSIMGNPVLGDKFYGNKASDIFSSLCKIKRQMLHARALSIKLPGKNKLTTFLAPFPEDFNKMIRLKKKD